MQLLYFKRKKLIRLLDFDEKKDAIFGEYDGKQGWFPASLVKVVTTDKQQSGTLKKSKDDSSASSPSTSASSSSSSLKPSGLSHSVPSVVLSGSATGMVQPKTQFSKQVQQFLKKQPNSASELKEANELIRRANRANSAKQVDEFLKKHAESTSAVTSTSKIGKMGSLSVPLNRITNIDEHGVPVIVNAILEYNRQNCRFLSSFFFILKKNLQI